MLHRDTGGLRELLARGFAAELELQPATSPEELLLALDHMHRHADRPRMVRDGPLNGLADPPRGVGRELVTTPPIELLNRAVQAERAFLNQIEEGDAQAAIA